MPPWLPPETSPSLVGLALDCRAGTSAPHFGRVACPRLGLVNHTHATATEFFYDAVMGDALSEEPVGIRHGHRILESASRQVNRQTTVFRILR